MPPHPLTENYYQHNSYFNSVHSRDNLPKVKDWLYLVNLDEHESAGAHWISLHVNGDNVTYFDNFGIGYIPKEIKKLICNKNITANI